jgi:hypothetical protein
VDGNPDYINGLVNVSKINKLSEIIFSFTSDNDVTYMAIEEKIDQTSWSFSDFIPFSETELDSWSKIAEPIDVEKKIIELFQEREAIREELSTTQLKLEEV